MNSELEQDHSNQTHSIWEEEIKPPRPTGNEDGLSDLESLSDGGSEEGLSLVNQELFEDLFPINDSHFQNVKYEDDSELSGMAIKNTPES